MFNKRAKSGMPAASSPPNNWRQLLRHEEVLLRVLAAQGGYPLENFSEYRSLTQDDGGMGSFYIRRKNQALADGPGREFSILAFKDADGVLVITSLFVNLEGVLREIDVWKVDFSSTKHFPLNEHEFFKPPSTDFDQSGDTSN